MTPILISLNNIPIYLKQDIMDGLVSHHQDHMIAQKVFESQWLTNKTIAILDVLPDLNHEKKNEKNELEELLELIDDLENDFKIDETN